MIKDYWTVLNKTYRLDGRVSRPQFWAFFLMQSFLAWSTHLFLGEHAHEAIQVALGLFLFLTLLSALCRRLHDIGHSGWRLGCCLLPLLGWLYLLILLLRQGDRFHNTYGPDPRIWRD